MAAGRRVSGVLLSLVCAGVTVGVSGCASPVPPDQARASGETVTLAVSDCAAAAGCAAPTLPVLPGDPVELGVASSVELALTSVPASEAFSAVAAGDQWRVGTSGVDPGTYLVSLAYAGDIRQVVLRVGS